MVTCRIRGLALNYKISCFVDFDTPVTRKLFEKVVKEIEEKTSVIIVAIVCDMGSTNRGFWTEMGVDRDQ